MQRTQKVHGESQPNNRSEMDNMISKFVLITWWVEDGKTHEIVEDLSTLLLYTVDLCPRVLRCVNVCVLVFI